MHSYFKNLPEEIIKKLVNEFQKLHKQYFLNNWDSSQLNGGRFGEAVLRIIEFKSTGSFTPIGTQLPRRQIVTQVTQNRSLPDSLRLYIPNLTELIMDFRNNRNVAHLGNIDVNEMDSSFVISACNWIMAELVRLETQFSPGKSQQIIKKIIERKMPIIEDIGGRLKVLDSNLTVKEQILVICYQKYPNSISFTKLSQWVKEKNISRFKQYLSQLDRNGLINSYNSKIQLTKKGVLWVEKNISFELSI